MASVSQSEAETAFFDAWNQYGLPGADIARQYVFHPHRKWRFDFAWPSQKVAVEIQGMGRFAPVRCNSCKSECYCRRCGNKVIAPQLGGHQTAQGMRNGSEKHNEAMMLGWRLLYFTTADYHPDQWVRTVSEFLVTHQLPVS